MTTIADTFPATNAVYEKYRNLVLETRNRTVPRFFRLTIEETKERNGGCSIIDSTPFTVVILQGDRVACQLVPIEQGQRAIWEPMRCSVAHASISPAAAARLLPYAELMAERMRMSGMWDGCGVVRAEVWATDALRFYKEDLAQAAVADGITENGG